ncbi:MAG: 8-amino-7-oxononanoate synthase [Gammaproteobacteria bacterium]|nr:8-amino-7-oxononanoate synthase [Gammaproteobacteria bacterium]
MKLEEIHAQLKQLDESQSLRTRRTLNGPQGVQVTLDDSDYLSFCSNDYLGLANDPRVVTAAVDALQQHGVGSGASQMISGYSTQHASFEKELAYFLGVERVLLFSSGYLANLGVVSALSSRHSAVFSDRLNHASLIDAAKLSDAKHQRYHHRDHQGLERLLQKTDATNKLILSDGVFSMEGSIAPLAELIALKKEHHALLLIDDAHGLGVLGEKGIGSAEQLQVNPEDIDLLIGTFGKAFGSSGAFVAGKHDLLEYIMQKARSLIYTTAAPAALIAACAKSLDIIQNEPTRRGRLQDNIAYYREQIKRLQQPSLDSISAIQSIVLGDNDTVIRLSQQLAAEGILVLPIRPPTVPANSARLRITLSSEHSKVDIDRLITALQQYL